MNGVTQTAASGLALDTPLRVGILNAAWNVQRHNTDHACVLDMARLSAFDDSLDVGFVPDPWQSLRCNANFVARRLGAPLPFPRIRLERQVFVECGGAAVEVLLRHRQIRLRRQEPALCFQCAEFGSAEKPEFSVFVDRHVGLRTQPPEAGERGAAEKRHADQQSDIQEEDLPT